MWINILYIGRFSGQGFVIKLWFRMVTSLNKMLCEVSWSKRGFACLQVWIKSWWRFHVQSERSQVWINKLLECEVKWFKAETHDVTNRCDRLLQQIASCDLNHCRSDRILSLLFVARIQTGLNSCDISQQQNKRKQPCPSVCTHLQQVAATKFKSTNEGTLISFSPC